MIIKSLSDINKLFSLLTVDRTITFPDKDMTVAGLDDLKEIGVGQTWQDVKASRAVNTVYTNTTGKPILVSVSVSVSVASTNLNLNIGGVTVQQFSSTAWMPNSYVTLTGIVPNNTNYYFAVVTGGVTIQSWGELR